MDITREQFKEGVNSIRDKNISSLCYVKDPVELYLGMVMKNFIN